MDDVVAVQEVQAPRHRQRHVPALVVPAVLVCAGLPVPPERLAQVAALRENDEQVSVRVLRLGSGQVKGEDEEKVWCQGQVSRWEVRVRSRRGFGADEKADQLCSVDAVMLKTLGGLALVSRLCSDFAGSTAYVCTIQARCKWSAECGTERSQGLCSSPQRLKLMVADFNVLGT